MTYLRRMRMRMSLTETEQSANIADQLKQDGWLKLFDWGAMVEVYGRNGKGIIVDTENNRILAKYSLKGVRKGKRNGNGIGTTSGAI